MTSTMNCINREAYNYPQEKSASALKPGVQENTLEDVWLDLKELSSYLHVSRSTLYNMINAGKLSMVRIGRQLRIKRETVDKLLLSGRLEL